VSDWISVAERRPEEGQFCVCLEENDVPYIDRIHVVNNGIGWQWGRGGTIHPHDVYKYWTPLPAPPPRKPTKDDAIRAAMEALLKAGHHDNPWVSQDIALRVRSSLRDALEA
jgi:hypothetical protein